ncbi:MAG: UTP--glucose-1-phosphate uridylyltransferase, partial [Candidatus Dojkabacteria bacterium]
IVVTGWHKRSIEDHFDYPYELEKRLEEWGKEHLKSEVRDIADMANFIYIRQKGPYGNATPIKCAKHLVQNEPFLVLWGDEFFLSKKPRTQQALDAFEEYNATILCGFMTEKEEDTKRYAYVDGKEISKGVWRVDRLIEKPGPVTRPSNLAIPSGYILTPDIFPVLKAQQPGKGGEYYLPEAINTLASTKPVYAVVLEYDHYFDTGNKLEYMRTVTEMALRHPEIGEDFKNYLRSMKL